MKNKKNKILIAGLLIICLSVVGQSIFATRQSDNLVTYLKTKYTTENFSNTTALKALLENQVAVNNVITHKPIFPIRLGGLQSKADDPTNQEEWCDAVTWAYMNPELAYQEMVEYWGGPIGGGPEYVKYMSFNMMAAFRCEL